MALERVVHPLQRQVRELFDPLGDRPAERAQRREELPLELGLTGPDEADARHRAVDATRAGEPATAIRRPRP